MASLPLDKLLERFLEQSADAEENFYKMEEQRLHQDERRREAEHARELHMLHVLGQIFGGIADSSGGSRGGTAAAAANVSATPMQSAPSPTPMSVHVAPASSSWSRIRSQHSRQQRQHGTVSPLRHHLPDHGLETVPGLPLEL